MSTFGKAARRLDREVAERQEWIDDVLSLDPRQQARLHEWIDSERESGQPLSEAAQAVAISVEGAELRLLHAVPRSAGTRNPTGEPRQDTAEGRPIFFVPGWGAVPEEFQEFYDMLHGRIELYYLETREKRSSTLRPKAEMSVEQSARDIGKAIAQLGLERRDFVLMGSCWGASIILEGLHQGTISAPTVLLVDPMKRLWFPRWLLRFVFRWTPNGVVSFLKPFIVWLKLLGMQEPRQRERAEQFIRAADIGKWRRAAVAARNFQLAGKLETIDKEVFVLNCSDDAVHDQRYYPVITDHLPEGRFVSLQVNERHRERMIGVAAREFAGTSSNQGLPENLQSFLKLG